MSDVNEKLNAIHERLGAITSDVAWIKDTLQTKSNKRTTIIGWIVVACVALTIPILTFSAKAIKDFDILVSLHKPAIEAVLQGEKTK